MAECDLKVKACRRCEKYYVPWPSNALHCPECKKEYNPQALYREKQKAEMTEKEREKDRIWRREYMQNYRENKKAMREAAVLRKKEKEEEEG